MAEGFLKSMSLLLDVSSAGTHPAREVHPLAVRVMKEVGIDIGGYHPKSVEGFLRRSFDYVITVCGNARETCPAFVGDVKHRIHIGFDDPASGGGSTEEVLARFRRVRDDIRRAFTEFNTSTLVKEP